MEHTTSPGRRRACPIRVTLALSIVFAAAHAAFHRIGTTANADRVEYTRNLAGGFLALGMTNDQPGFIVLSALERDEVEVGAVQATSRLAGMHTVVEIQTPRGMTRTRLRGPEAILVSEQGLVEAVAVDWSVAEFHALREAADCSHRATIRKHRCGAPFADVREALEGWSADRIPDRVRAFLSSCTDHARGETIE